MSNARPATSPLYRLFADQADRDGDAVAVRDERESLTYAQLLRRVLAVSARLWERFPEPGARIGLHLERGCGLVVAVLAVTAAGHAYVPLDPAYPVDRLRFMAADSELSVVLADQPLPPELSGAVDVLRIDQPASATTSTEPVAPVDGDAIAYVIYTSGSTGRPKGVQVRQRNVIALIEAACARHEFTRHDVWTLFHSYSFDFAVWELWGALATGGTLVVVSAATALSPRAGVEMLVREKVTVLNIVPSVFRHLVAAARALPARPETVRRVIFGGEAVDLADIRTWRSVVRSGCEFVNGYGITETTVLTTTRTFSAQELDSEETAFATELGPPLRGWEVLVLDEAGNPVGPGETGEIWIAGTGVAVGYLNRPDLTEQRFPTRRTPEGELRRYYRSGDLATRAADGTLHFAGRADDQVKINGFRIELGEIESVLRRLPQVRDAAVVRAQSRIGGQMLSAFYVLKPGAESLDLAEQAGRLLPRHMVPSRFVQLSELPLNPSGKTDRRALSEFR